MLTAQEELEKFLDRRARAFEKAMMRVAVATFLRPQDMDDALQNLALTIRETLILADLHGRKRLLMEADALSAVASMTMTPINPTMEFTEALTDLVTREPRLASSSMEVSRLYSTGHVFAMARSISEKLTVKVQKIVADLIREGRGGVETERDILRAAIEESHNWTSAYSATVYRTNVTGAYARGRIEQAQDPDVKQVIPALRYTGIDDARTRPNHRAAFGLIAASDDPIWLTHTPPLGHQCRCALEHVSVYELERRGLWRDGQVTRYEPPGFSAAVPDEGFRI